MKTTLELPDDLFERASAAAERRGISLDAFVAEALKKYLERQTAESSSQRGWRSVFGQATQAEVASVDAVVGEELGHVDPDDWQ
ncbi:MAG TPA: CopG family transcriptional regulator [Thermoanaerobaculia bacterium]